MQMRWKMSSGRVGVMVSMDSELARRSAYGTYLIRTMRLRA